MGTMRILDRTGDTCVAWTLDDPASLAEAEALFDRLQAECKIPFARAAGAPAAEAERIARFDPAAEEILWVRPVAGG
jgi:predicted trehalose synthase